MRKEVNPGYMGGTQSDVALATALITRAPEAACLQGQHEEGLGSHNTGEDRERTGVAHISENRHIRILQCSRHATLSYPRGHKRSGFQVT